MLEAADLLSESTAKNAISDTARKKALSKIENDKEKIKSELMTVSPKEDFSLENGAVNKDLIDEFVTLWKNTQAWTHGECDARGISLKFATEIEQKFYYRLGLDKITPNRSAKYMAFEPDK